MHHALKIALTSLLLLSGLGLGLGACNTISGAGRDIEAAGDAISDAAEDVKEEM